MEKDPFIEIAGAKRADRIERAKRSFEEKIDALVRMQKRRAQISALRGKKTRMWGEE